MVFKIYFDRLYCSDCFGLIGRIFLRIYLARLARRMQQQSEADKGQKVGETYIKDTASKENR